MIVAELASLLAVSATVTTSLECIQLEGEAALVQKVAAEITTQSPCRKVNVSLHEESGRIVIQQPGGPARQTTSSIVAAAIIESWTNVSIIAKVLKGPPPSPTPIQTHASVTSAPPAVTEVKSKTRSTHWGGLLRFEGGVAEDTSFSGGLLARGDLELSILTPWVGVRLGLNPAAVTRENGNAAARNHGEILAGVDVPLRAGGFVFAPGLAAGVGYERTARKDAGPVCTVTSCATLQGTLLQDEFVNVSFGPRFELSVRLARKIASQLAFDAGLVFSYAPLADRDGAVPTYAQTLPAADQTAFSLPAESRFAARLGLGLRWGIW